MKRFLGICLAAFLATFASSAVAKTSTGGLNAAEKWVIAQVTAGEKADLNQQFPVDKDRKVSAHFLEGLLTGALPDVKPHRHGVRIIGAIIDEPVDLENAQIPCEVWLEHCQFNANTTFSGASFAETISIENSTFKADADFNSIKVGRDAFIDAVFEGPVNFSSADITGNFEARGAKFQNEETGANFNSTKVRGDAFLSDAVFKGPVVFVMADIAGSFLVTKAKFQNKEKEANFSGIKVGGYAVFSHVVWQGPVNLSLADIAGTFTANEAQFESKEKAVNFTGLKVGGDAFFNSAVCQGPVNFVSANIAGGFAAAGAKFQNKEKEANFTGLKVGGDAVFNGAVFEGRLNFSGAEIASNFVANDAQFRNKEKEANFNSLKIRGGASFTNSVWKGAVSFSGADIASNFEAQGTKFQNKEKITRFNNMKVRGNAVFNDAVFKGPVVFAWTDIAGMFAMGKAKFQSKENEANFSGMKVGSYAFFNDAVFEGPVNFAYSDFAWLNLSSTSWPKRAAKFNMQGMSYKYIRAAPEEPDSHKALLKLAGRSAYSADVYGNLEAFFFRQGYRGDADRAFIAGKRRERKEYPYGLARFGSWSLDWLVGYGRRPWQAGIPCAVLIGLGCVLFSPKKMEPQEPEDTPRVYNRFWYSLDLFLPFVDLQADDVWKPKTNERFLRHYVRLHVMLGWILIPIVLAALTGLIK
jgi:uncharacterized protein YjbI with pentapeptide repeats